jgi:histidinol-phosphate aminotransferase
VGTDADALNDALLRRGVIVRPMGSFGAPSALRISAGTPEEIAFLAEQLASVFATT